MKNCTPLWREAHFATIQKNTVPLSFHQRIRSAIHASQQITSPMVVYL
jgi:hypothetical protein